MRTTYIVIECPPLGSGAITRLLSAANITFTHVEPAPHSMLAVTLEDLIYQTKPFDPSKEKAK